MNTYLHAFSLPSEHDEHEYIRCTPDLVSATDYYPFKSFFRHQTSSYHRIHFDFEPLTIFYGNNGSGKTTLLNIIAEKLALDRKSAFNQSPYFSDYLSLCLTDVGNLYHHQR